MATGILYFLATTLLVLQFASAQTPTSSPDTLPYPGDEPPYQIIPTGTDIQPGPTNASVLNRIGTKLWDYKDCSSTFGAGAKGKIDGAYYDAWVMSNTEGVAENIDWNNAAALDFLGAPAYNLAERSQIQAVFANAATVIYIWTLEHPEFSIAVVILLTYLRPPNPGKEPAPKPTPLAYAANLDDTGYPVINFCEGFFKTRNLNDAVTWGSALRSPYKYNLEKYENRALIFFHELLHLNLAADSPSPNPPVLDLQADYWDAKLEEEITQVIYGPLWTKIMARFHNSAIGSSGYWVQRNADNLAYYALAKYVTSKIGNVYPHLPIVDKEITGVPHAIGPLDLIATFTSDPDGGNLALNITGYVHSFNVTLDADGGYDYPGCSDDMNPASSADPTLANITIDRFAPDSAYPSDYISQRSSWISELYAAFTTSSMVPSTTPTVTSSLVVSTSAPPSSTSSISSTSSTSPPPLPPPPPPSYATGTCSFHLSETQNCLPASQNLFAIITLKDNAGNTIGATDVSSTHPLGAGINDGSSYIFTSKLPYTLIVTGEHTHDYIQFAYAGVRWSSTMKEGAARCNTGGWNPRMGPVCEGLIESQNAVREMDCFFPC
ncbi:hypothetical protein NHQ30_009316 [Ciborinia camelliae]|nr:hypothetical protein NHQ30_009316 [Ciborinia camelliae]